jgi:hypothetical protein
MSKKREASEASEALREVGELSGEKALPEDFAELERLFVHWTEDAIAQGIQLEKWMRDPNRQIRETLLPSDPHDKLRNRAWGYLPEVTIDGVTSTAIGARQEVEFGAIPGPNPGEQLKEYVLGRFLNDATWLYADGASGGFTIEQLIYRRADGRHGRYDLDRKTQIRDWREIGPVYRWSLFTIILNDFVFRMGRMKAPFVPRGAVTVVQSPEFVHVVEKPMEGIQLEVAIGFPFIRHAPIPNFFGFGPGKFAWAVQTFSFLLRDDNTVVCHLDFVAGPRPKQVFVFGKLPCPIYGPADLLGKLTFGLFPAGMVHRHFDMKMALRHCRVHQALMEGTAKIFAASVRDQSRKRA